MTDYSNENMIYESLRLFNLHAEYFESPGKVKSSEDEEFVKDQWEHAKREVFCRYPTGYNVKQATLIPIEGKDGWYWMPPDFIIALGENIPLACDAQEGRRMLKLDSPLLTYSSSPDSLAHVPIAILRAIQYNFIDILSTQGRLQDSQLANLQNKLATKLAEAQRISSHERKVLSDNSFLRYPADLSLFYA